jgi:hypothetical protein
MVLNRAESDPMKHFINRASLVVGIACLCMVPIGFVYEVNEWGDFPPILMLGYFTWSVIFATVNYHTQPVKKEIAQEFQPGS